MNVGGLWSWSSWCESGSINWEIETAMKTVENRIASTAIWDVMEISKNPAVIASSVPDVVSWKNAIAVTRAGRGEVMVGFDRVGQLWFVIGGAKYYIPIALMRISKWRSLDAVSSTMFVLKDFYTSRGEGDKKRSIFRISTVCRWRETMTDKKMRQQTAMVYILHRRHVIIG